MGFIADSLNRIQPSATLAVTSKALELTAQGKDIISLAAGEPDFDTPPHVVEAAVKALRDGLGLPGMRILQFAFGGDGEHEFLPHTYTRNVVVYTGTHDNDTALGWYTSADAVTQHRFRVYTGRDGSNPVWALLREAWASVGATAVALNGWWQDDEIRYGLDLAKPKVLVADAKRLERGRFVWPSTSGGSVSISAAQLGYMLDGIDWRNPVHTFRPERAG